ncbi:MAG: DCC1-like thiol-disulfide oxidoreductase family protein [Pseudomonadota bacterium]
MDSRHLIVFDGVCNFCNGSVNFIMKRDPAGVFVFTPMQTQLAREIMLTHQIDNVGVDTFLLVKKGRPYIATDAALEISKDLTGYWYLFNAFKVIPRPIRDWFYRLFARNRYVLFGKADTCMVPTPEVRARFVGVQSEVDPGEQN